MYEREEIIKLSLILIKWYLVKRRLLHGNHSVVELLHRTFISPTLVNQRSTASFTYLSSVVARRQCLPHGQRHEQLVGQLLPSEGHCSTSHHDALSTFVVAFCYLRTFRYCHLIRTRRTTYCIIFVVQIRQDAIKRDLVSEPLAYVSTQLPAVYSSLQSLNFAYSIQAKA